MFGGALSEFLEWPRDGGLHRGGTPVPAAPNAAPFWWWSGRYMDVRLGSDGGIAHERAPRRRRRALDERCGGRRSHGLALRLLPAKASPLPREEGDSGRFQWKEF